MSYSSTIHVCPARSIIYSTQLNRYTVEQSTETLNSNNKRIGATRLQTCIRNSMNLLHSYFYRVQKQEKDSPFVRVCLSQDIDMTMSMILLYLCVQRLWLNVNMFLVNHKFSFILSPIIFCQIHNNTSFTITIIYNIFAL